MFPIFFVLLDQGGVIDLLFSLFFLMICQILRLQSGMVSVLCLLHLDLALVMLKFDFVIAGLAVRQ